MTREALPDLDETAEETGPLRTCVATRDKLSPDAMIRLVLSPHGEVTPDLRRRLPGRGVWVTARADCVRLALKRQAFARQLKPRGKGKDEPSKIITPADLDHRIDALMEADALQSLSLANKAGAVVSGFAKVEAAIAAGPVAAVLNASEGGADGLRKITQVLRRHAAEGAPFAPDINIFASVQLDLALGRTNVIHAAILQKSAGAAFVARALKLAAYRTTPDQLAAAVRSIGAHVAQRQPEIAPDEDDVLTGPTPEGRTTNE